MKTMCSSCMRISDTKVCMACRTKQHKARRQEPRYKNIWATPRWRQVREYVLSRDHYRCTRCNVGAPPASLQAHHLHYDAPFDPATIVTICRQCHARYHATNPPALD